MVRYIADTDSEDLTLHEPPPKAYLALIANERISQSFPLRNEVHLGRDKSNSVVVSDKKVSRHHATLEPVEDAFIITDRGSANGTFLNGVLITQPVRLKDKDHIIVGDTHFLFSTSEPQQFAVFEAAIAPPPSNNNPAFQIPGSNAISANISALNDKSVWALVGCLGLIVVGLLVIVALLIGLFLGISQATTAIEFLWLTTLF